MNIIKSIILNGIVILSTAVMPAMSKEMTIVKMTASFVKSSNGHLSGGFSPNTVSVHPGDAVDIKIHSLDLTHGFQCPSLGIDELIPGGETVDIKFIAGKPGSYPFNCGAVCGPNHARMTGIIVVK